MSARPFNTLGGLEVLDVPVLTTPPVPNASPLQTIEP